MNKHPFWESRQLRILHIDCGYFLPLLLGRIRVDKTSLPPDVEILNMTFDPNWLGISYVIGSSEFEPLTMGEIPPIHQTIGVIRTIDEELTDALTNPKRGHLAVLLSAIEANDSKYSVRQRLVITAVAVAVGLGYQAGFRIDPKEPDWPVAYIELPDIGQVTWHLEKHTNEWDGHDTETKYERCRMFIETI